MCECEDKPCCGCNSLYELRAPAEAPDYDPEQYHDYPDAEPYYMIETEEEGEWYLVEYMGKFDTEEQATAAMNKADWDSMPRVVELY